jgi:K+-sensing histidine kinase KdpD
MVSSMSMDNRQLGKKGGNQRRRVLRRVDFLIGGVICAIAALAVSVIAAGHAWQPFVPLFFVAILALIALLFGAGAGIAGTLAAALIFAVFLFSPLGKVQVASYTARTNLGWMLLIGIAFSFLFAPPASGLRRE